MASTRIIGYVGGVAVAAGVGAAIAVASQGVANADADSGSEPSKSSVSDAGSDPAGLKAGPKADTKPVSADTTKDTTEDTTEDTGEHATTDTTDADKPHRKPSLTTKLRQSAEAFEAEQVEKLRAVFTPKPVKEKPSAPRDSTAKPLVQPVAEAESAATPSPDPDQSAAAAPSGVLPPGVEPTAPSANPLRPEDPAPFAMPALFRNLELAVLNSPFVSRDFAPVVREGFELAYRGSQMVPWVNTVVPATEILPQVILALAGDEQAREATQIVVNQLLLTTQPVSLLFYGYDEVADLLNMEFAAQELKEDFYATAWNILDPLHLLHIAGHSGLERYPGGVGAALGSG